ncbi:MAG: hypothetical protein KC777_19280 [Cyanobacteria bacterium HKST-UBA02]|nr:hypothetical protein [Cyanobacteria bacterium HKST-UBA02]
MLKDERLLITLRELYSFVQFPNTRRFRKSSIPKNDRILGVYINTPDNFILVGVPRLFWIRGDELRVIPYSSIYSVEIEEDDEALLILTHLDKSESVLEVLGMTDDYPDIHVFRDFLNAVIYYPHQSREPNDILGVHSAGGLAFFLHEQSPYWFESTSLVGQALDRGFPKPWQLRRFNIDPEILKSPDVWRFLALFLCKAYDEGYEDYEDFEDFEDYED